MELRDIHAALPICGSARKSTHFEVRERAHGSGVLLCRVPSPFPAVACDYSKSSGAGARRTGIRALVFGRERERTLAPTRRRMRYCFHAGPVAWVERNGLSLWLGESDSAGPLVLDASTSSKATARALRGGVSLLL